MCVACFTATHVHIANPWGVLKKTILFMPLRVVRLFFIVLLNMTLAVGIAGYIDMIVTGIALPSQSFQSVCESLSLCV